MSRRDARAAGLPARHVRTRLQAALGEAPSGLLREGSGEAVFEYRGPGGERGGGADGDSAAAAAGQEGVPDGLAAPGPTLSGHGALAPALRWRLGSRLAMFVAVVAVAGGAWFWWQAASGQAVILPLEGAGPASAAATLPGEGSTTAGGGSTREPAGREPGGESAATLVIHVAGAVARPGVVHLPAGSRVHEAIAAAGGAAVGADLNRLNLALVLEDGQKIHVPQEGADVPVAGPEGNGQPGADDSGGSPAGTKINLNTAGVEDLDALPKVGPVLAQRIVDWRKEHGAFKSIEELDAVDGVGPKMLEALLPLVTV
ncbi:competence protein ComEA-like protein with helix-hairpin-helix repeat region [Pseudarthrobacter phenanthrenivorans Sphe3]|uniref:Competence protein ComEA-like protein with helix-hairpin-helix repeat region n=2 Tax=Pseudarthrobacter phenanthrenivorans TaxID=361575 RepID=F0M1X7_PSEPM|nr:competence protein ComEA-like protein with helix-hairpin-helix repeat region [Pseudarthrobacter phenanthrenivorans Sphe3]